MGFQFVSVYRPAYSGRCLKCSHVLSSACVHVEAYCAVHACANSGLFWGMRWQRALPTCATPSMLLHAVTLQSTSTGSFFPAGTSKPVRFVCGWFTS